MNIVPNKNYLLIGSVNGPEGSNVGRTVRTVRIMPGVPHTLWGYMWIITCPNGVPFEYTKQDGEIGFMNQVHAAEDWLQELPEDPPKQADRVKELDLVS